jgi:hypothetical protein
MKRRCHIDQTELLARLRGAMGERLDKAVIVYLLRRGLVEQAVDAWGERQDDRAIQDLLDEYIDAKRLADRSSTPRRSTLEPLDDPRIRAANQLAAAAAADFDYVLSFRQDVLKNRFLPEAAAAEWLRAQAQADGKATWQERPAVAEFERELVPLTLSYPDADGRRRVLIREDGVLGRLKRVAEALCASFPTWSEAGAVWFVLTGLPPEVTVKVSIRTSDHFPAVSTISVEAPARVHPRIVSALYAQLRAQTLGARAKSMSDENTELGLFAAVRNDGRSWRAAMEEWNEANPSQLFNDPKRFARDCALSYKRITGQKLVWSSRPSKSESPRRS